MKPWIIKYLPKNPEEILDRKEAVAKIKDYIKNPCQKPILLAGPPGCGKTSIISALAKGMDLIEINASDTRNKDAILSTIGEAIKQQSLFMKPRMILVDEVDGIAGNKDRGGLATITKILSSSRVPIILTANDPNTDKLRPLRKACRVMELEPLPHELIVRKLTSIISEEKPSLSQDTIRSIARRSGGDLRAAINDLQIVAQGGGIELSTRDTTQEISVALTRVFKTTSAEVALGAFDNVKEDLDKIFLWIDENLPREYKRPDDIAMAYEMLAEADRFFGRIRRWQYYRFYVYIYALLTVGIALSKNEKYKGLPDYKRSERPLKIWISNNAKAKKKRIAEKMAAATHTSIKRAMAEMPIIMAGAKRAPYFNMIAESFGLDDDEKKWLKTH